MRATMALTYDGMPCSLCGEPIVDPSRDTFVMTMWGIDDLRFVQLDDSACHQTCIDSWKLRDCFIEYCNRNCKEELFVDRAGHLRYRFDYINWAMNAGVLTLGIMFCLPTRYLREDCVAIPAMDPGCVLVPEERMVSDFPDRFTDDFPVVLIRSGEDVGIALDGGYDAWAAFRDRVLRDMNRKA